MTDFHEDFSLNYHIVPPSDRSTGLVFAAMAMIVAGLWYQNPQVWVPTMLIALGFLLLSLVAPRMLGPLKLLWFRLSMLLYRIVNPVLMLLLYLLTIVPAGLIMQQLRDPLRAKRQPDHETYWVEDTPDASSSSMKNQF
jgi:hypothetical protein